jgi:uncharacterized protein (UPF0332 family)
VRVRSKAARTLAEARFLASAGFFDGASSRCYYALYQEAVARLGNRGRRPSEFGSIDSRHPGKWSHAVILRSLRAAGFSPDEVLTVRRAWSLRVQADYTAEGVDPHLGWAIIRQVGDVLEPPEGAP